ncbi:putative bifunctional diguanylate cyclase/phosphodiesterase [Rhodocyclus gracilis]|uniref:EAL domain-containing protein n=1 Tax=Rhodocyclus tenuis TaxID=1066 RepID=A0A6L5JUW1_RHOTE|nr:EAL domain-containing protein [Rhodocyclus gracilis]MQY50989.1 EAL domain-containing protein [Rhodocyclus gracilis]
MTPRLTESAAHSDRVVDAGQRQFVFINDGRLQEMPTVRNLLRFLVPVRSHAPSHETLERFLADEELYALPVVDANDRPLALVDRRKFIEFFSKPYSREIFGRRSIVDLLQHAEYQATAPVIVEDSCSVEDVAQIIITAGMQHMVTGFIVSSAGRYLGVANGHDLLNVITQRKQSELYYLAHYDHLTGIPNRVLLADRLDQACRDSQRKGTLAALLFVDVDRFKQINDSLGHSVGDAVLRVVVERLKKSARRNDTLARLGGDEFVILMEDLEDAADVDRVAQRLLDSMRERIELFGHSLVVTVSVGAALYPVDDTALSPLLAKADAAMYEAKSAGRNRFCRYSKATAMYNPARMSLENDLRRAIESNELVLFFQPQVELASHELRGVEALVRWQHPERGLVSPVHFIPVAEESGLIVPLGNWVLRESLRQLREWNQQGLPPLRMSINISALQFRQGDLPRYLAEQLTAFAVDPQQVELELTESVLMNDVEGVLRTLQEIKSLGVSLAIDDFGTGYSSLSYLRRFPIDRLKIDQSFVRDIEQTPANESIARAIVALADSLSLGIVAEGIEKRSEKAILQHMRCAEGQGYLFAKPLPADDIVAWIGHHLQSQGRPAFPAAAPVPALSC